MRFSNIMLLIFLVSSYSVKAQGHSFLLGKSDFLLDGKPFQIISGEMHPARIPREYWQHRIQMAKAMGCNTIAAYIFWNFHESKEGVFDFRSDNHDIAAFIRICAKEKMWVLLRPGPYVCAEWDFGGIPTYLLKYPDIRIRCMDSRYITAAKRYIQRLAKEVTPLQVTHGGPVLMVQVENEYGSYANDQEYLETLRTCWIHNGINVPFYTADGATPYMLEAGHIKGTAIGLDSGSGDEDFAQANKSDPDVPSFSSETYPGWLSHWGEKYARPDTADLKKEMEYLLSHKKSFNLYVIHGGTNFGMTAGANAFSPTQFQPDITSYDYDAPVNEQGLPTPKYFMLRNMIAHYNGKSLIPLPAPIPTIEIPPIRMEVMSSIWDHLPEPKRTAQPQSFESFGQNQGIAIYHTILMGHHSGKLKIWEPHDYALIFLNGKFIDTIKRDGGNWTVELPKTDDADPVLDIVIEGMGHINFAQFMIDRKGITDRVTLNGMTLMTWKTYLFPMNDMSGLLNQVKATQKRTTTRRAGGTIPCMFFKGEFDLQKTGDVYFDMSTYRKGYFYINGHLLGRYWNIGPQERLYCPASWLKEGKNEIIIFDLHQMEAKEISGKRTLSD